jgi:hypothetical protein
MDINISEEFSASVFRVEEAENGCRRFLRIVGISYKITQCYNTEENLNFCHENLKSQIAISA